MNLVPYTVTALQLNNADSVSSTKNTIASAVVTMKTVPSEVTTVMYDDANGTNPATSKLTNASGFVVVWIESGSYLLSINGTNSYITAGAKTINSTIIANVPSDFATMQDVIDYYSQTFIFSVDGLVEINIESGHQPASGIAVSNGDYSKFIISSDNAEVTLDPSFNPNTSVINCINAKSPILDTLFDCNGIIDTAAFNLTGGSTGFVNPNKGMKNGNNRGLHVQNSSNCYADYAVFTGFGQAGIHSSRDGTIQCSYADVSGCSQDPANSFGALYASRGSLIHGADIDVSNSGGDGVRAQRQATIVCAGVNVSGCEKIAFVANGGNISCDSSPPIMTAIKGQAVVVQSGGQIHMGINTITFAAGMTDKAIDCENGRVIAKGITMSGYEGIGVYGLGANSLIDVSDITLSGGTYGLWALDNANINAESCSITGASAIGVNCVSGAKISVEDGTVTGSGSLDINLAKGAWVTATNCTTTAGVGTPAIADTNMSVGFNFSNNGSKGFLWV